MHNKLHSGNSQSKNSHTGKSKRKKINRKRKRKKHQSNRKFEQQPNKSPLITHPRSKRLKNLNVENNHQSVLNPRIIDGTIITAVSDKDGKNISDTERDRQVQMEFVPHFL